MMRDIKFRQYLGRGYRKDFGMTELGWCGPIFTKFDKYPVSQYTGLKDKNGKEIYESDRINEYDGIVVYRDGAFWVDHIHGDDRKQILLKKWIAKRNMAGVGTEIIGNIHQNQGLLDDK